MLGPGSRASVDFAREMYFTACLNENVYVSFMFMVKERKEA